MGNTESTLNVHFTCCLLIANITCALAVLLHRDTFTYLTYQSYLEGVFNDSTSCGLEMYGKEHPQFLDTSRYVKFITNIWKVMSVKSPSKGTARVYILLVILVFCNEIYQLLNKLIKHYSE